MINRLKEQWCALYGRVQNKAPGHFTGSPTINFQFSLLSAPDFTTKIRKGAMFVFWAPDLTDRKHKGLTFQAKIEPGQQPNYFLPERALRLTASA